MDRFYQNIHLNVNAVFNVNVNVNFTVLNINKKIIFFITVSYPCNGRESTDFESNFQNKDFDGFTRHENP